MTRIGVISDTHGLLRPEAEERLAGMEQIIHAGDIGDPGIVPRLRRIAPTTVIRGNVDSADWAAEYPERITVEIGGRTFHLLHDLKELDVDPVAAGFDVVIAGHSHRPKAETIDGVLYLNPGSAGPRRFRLPITLATLELTEDRIEATIHAILV
ncbi:MAG: metallophosphoesterase family protein [Paracoccaceae bacterium]